MSRMLFFLSLQDKTCRLVSHLVIDREGKEESQIRNPLIFLCSNCFDETCNEFEIFRPIRQKVAALNSKKTDSLFEAKKKVFGVVERAQGLTNTI